MCSFCDIVTEKKPFPGYHKVRKENKEENNMAYINVNKHNFQEEVLQSDRPVLVDFWASWCGPCRMVIPLIEEIAEEREDIKVVKINVDEEQELAMQYQIMSIPTLMVFKNGEITAQALGALPKNQILDLLEG
ncbi:MAG: thioredoxin [Oscillospiraceae bacterium]|nr:thioredoxin [Oscillospiraceae bacterium]